MLRPAKADQCSAARRTSPITSDPKSQMPQNTPCMSAFIPNAMSVADRGATGVRPLRQTAVAANAALNVVLGRITAVTFSMSAL